MLTYFRIIFALVLLASGIACSNDVELNAPAINKLVVYSILNPDADIQYVRVSKVFLPEGNALDFASANDPGLNRDQVIVTLNGVVLRDTTLSRQAGVFPAGLKVFYCTNADLDIVPGQTYTLDVQYLADATANVKAYTRVPQTPDIVSPFSPTFAGGVLIRNTEVQFENTVKITFRRTPNAAAYESKVVVQYLENGNPRTSVFGPKLFVSNNRCTEQSANNLCYGFERRELIDYLGGPQVGGNLYGIIDTPITKPVNVSLPIEPQRDGLNNSVYLSITAIDTFFYQYLAANNANSSTLATSVLEYSNVENGLGILGSVCAKGLYVDFTQCGKYLLRYNNTPRPAGRCE